jgi:excisionase family DNA binding protein
MKPKYIKPAEAAAFMSVSMNTIYRYMRAKSLKSYKVGKSRLIKIDDLVAMIEGNELQPS